MASAVFASVPILNAANAQLESARSCFESRWFGNASDVAKLYLDACIEKNGVSTYLLVNIMAELNEIMSLEKPLQRKLDLYAIEKTNYELAEKNQDAAQMSLSIKHMREYTDGIESDQKAINDKIFSIQRQYSYAVKTDITLPTEVHTKYVLSSSVTNEIIKKIDDSLNSLESFKKRLQGPEYDNRILYGIAASEIRIKTNFTPGVARDMITTAASWLIIQLEMIKMGINHHVSNIEKFENGEEVPLTNMFGQNIGASSGDGTSVPGTNPNESAEGDDTETQQEEKQETYVMKPGDTLIGVAAMYPGLTWKEIADANNITDTRNIPVGKELVIPGQTTNVPDAPNTNDSGGNPTQEKGEYIPAESFEGYQELKFSAIGETNWASEATSMNEGDYDSPFVVNSDGKMVDINGEEIWLQRGIGEGSNHRGFDYNGSKGNNGAADAGTPVYSLGSGIVIKADECKNPNNHNSYTESNNYGYGSTVWVLHEVVDDEGSVHYEVSKYEHFQQGSINVGVGDVVDENTILGAMGTTGKSTNVHLHLEVLRVPDDTLSAEDLAGKSTEEVVDIVQNKKLDTYEYTYDKSNWVDFNQSLEDKDLL